MNIGNTLKHSNFGNPQLPGMTLHTAQQIASPQLTPHQATTIQTSAQSTSKPVNIETVLEQLASFGAMDVEFIILALQIKERETQISKQLKGIQRRNKLKHAIGNKLDRLRKLKTLLQGTLGKDKGNDTEVSAKELNKYVNKDCDNKDCNPTKAEWQAINAELGVIDATFAQDPTTGKVTEVGDKVIGSKDTLGKEGKDYRLDADMVDAAIEKYNDLQQRVGSDNELDMIKLKDLIDKKSQLVLLLSSINKKKNDTRSSVINNFR